MTEPPATVIELARAVVKGTRQDHPRASAVGAAGLEGDRRFHVVTAGGAQLGAPRSRLAAVVSTWDDAGRLVLAFPDGSQAGAPVELGASRPGRATWDGDRPIAGREVLGPFAAALSGHLGEPVGLVEATEPLAARDVAAVTLISEASVARLESDLGGVALGARRFRMNVLAGGLEAYGEDDWTGRRVQAGGCMLRVTGPVPRCVVVTRDADSGRRDHGVLKAIVTTRAPRPDPEGRLVRAPFGVYADVERPGRIAVGDALVPLD